MTERAQMDVDVLIIGAGPAGLAAAIRLMDAAEERGVEPPNVMVLEKASEVGGHILSGAIMDPKGLDELIPDWQDRDCPVDTPVEEEKVRFLTENLSMPLPVPPPMENDGNWILSLGQLVRWLGEVAEEKGVQVFPGFAGWEPLYDGEQVVGVRTGDRGVDEEGNQKSNYEPGMDIHADITLFGEGVHGSLLKQLDQRFDLYSDENPQVYATAVKELWRVPDQVFEKGRVLHTLGYPLGEEFGGSWMYHAEENLLSIGFVVGLDYKNPKVEPNTIFQKFKLHPSIQPYLEDGEMLEYGAKAIPEGGFYSMPKLYLDGAMIIGDSAGFVNMQRLKGIHLGIKSGIMAAETAIDAIQEDEYGEEILKGYRERFEESWAYDEMYKSRNFRQAFRSGPFLGMLRSGAQMLFGGRLWKNRLPTNKGHLEMQKLEEFGETGPDTESVEDLPENETEEEIVNDKLEGLYHSNTTHEEDQPPHLIVHDTDICHTRCTEEYGNPCQEFCPANVYEMVENENGEAQLRINAANCVHCKTCDIMDPYQIITWVPPEGGGGPVWKKM